VGRVVWINGSFSSGKTTVAQLLVEQLDTAFLLDPELIGLTLRDHLVPPALYPEDFQDLDLWRSFTRDAVRDAAQRFEGFVIVPMTIARADYFQEVIVAVARAVRLDHFTLMASRETILRRELTRPDATGGWAQQTIDRVLPALEHSRFAEHIDAETQTADGVAQDILRRIATC
jgi:chloramphenicol 3-O-phosphotransferase